MAKRKVRITNTGYLPDSPDRYNPMNIIPSNQITMDTVPFPIMGIDNLGNQQMMMPGGEYEFPGEYVTEIPMGSYQNGGGIYMGDYEFKDGGLVKMPIGGANRYQGAITLDEINKLTKKETPIALMPPQTAPAYDLETAMSKGIPILEKDLERKKITKKEAEYSSSPKFAGESYLYKSSEDYIPAYEKSTDHKLRFKNESQYTEDDVKQIQKDFVDKGIIESKELKISDYKTKDEIIGLQKLLAENGLMDDLGNFGENKDGIDGRIGSKTRAAVEKYNKYNKGFEDGKLDDTTKKAIRDFKNKQDTKRTLGLSVNTDLSGMILPDGSANVGLSNKSLADFEKGLMQKGYFTGLDYDTSTIPDSDVNPRVAFKFKLNPDSKTPFGMCAQYVNGTVCDEDAAGFEARENLGLNGSAWHISDNIQKKGGKAVFLGLPDRSQVGDLKNADDITNYLKSTLSSQKDALKNIVGTGVTWDSKVKPGDVVNIFYEGSNYTQEAFNQTKSLNNRLFTTHVGVVKADNDGNLYVEHNIHGKVEKDKINDFLDGKVKGNGKGKVSMISGITRPNYYEGVFDDGSGIPSDGVSYYQTEYGKFNPKGATTRQDMDYLGQSVSGKNTFKLLKTIEKNKDKVLKDIPISENEFDKLMRTTRAIPTLETYGGLATEQEKELRRKKAIESGFDVDFSGQEKWLQDTFMENREKSMGITKLKDESNLNPILRKKLIKSDAELDTPEKAALPTFYKLSKDYLYLKEVVNSYGMDVSTDELAKLAGLGYNQAVGKIASDLVQAGSYDNYIAGRKQKAKQSGSDKFKYEDLIDIYDKQTMRKGGNVQGMYLGKYEFKDGGLVRMQEGGLIEYQNKGQVDQKELERRAKSMGWNTVDEYKNANWKRNTKSSTNTSDTFDLALDAASFVPGPVGMGASGIGLVKNLYEGDYTGAALDGLNIVTGGAAKWLRGAEKAAKLYNSSKVANKVARQAKFLETASNPLIPKTVGALRDVSNYQWGEAFEPFSNTPTALPNKSVNASKSYTPSEKYMMDLKIQENAEKKGFNKKSNRWSPHPSEERGNDTIAYGHKLTDEEVRKGTYAKGITEEQAAQLFKKDVIEHADKAKEIYNRNVGKNAFDKVPDTLKDLLVDYTYNGVLPEYENFMGAMHRYSTAKTPQEKQAAQQKMLKEYKRTSKGKNLTSRNAYTKAILESLPIKQDGGSKEMPLDLPLKEQNIYLLPEYNQPINLFTGEILPDMRRPNLGMDTGATEYKYTYGSDEGDIDVPSIVSGQYIGDKALDRYNLTGERFKTMNDPGSYSKFYNEMNQLGLMQERNGGSVKKVKIKRLPRKRQ